MIKYSEFQPTGFDPKGLGCSEQQEWLVAPVSVTRDSKLLEQSNWQMFVDWCNELPDDTWDLHRFGHWGPGWFEIILLQPRTAAEALGVQVGNALADYPVLSDEDYSQREYDATCDNIGTAGSSLVSPDALEGWTGEVFSWLWDNAQHELESTDGNGGWPSEDSLIEAFKALGILDQEEYEFRFGE